MHIPLRQEWNIHGNYMIGNKGSNNANHQEQSHKPCHKVSAPFYTVQVLRVSYIPKDLTRVDDNAMGSECTA